MPQDWFSINAPKANPSAEDWFASNAPKSSATPAPERPESRGLLSPTRGPEDFPVYNMAKGAVKALAQIPGALYQTVTDPVGTVRAVGEAQGRLGVDAKAAFDRGDYLRAGVKGAEYLLPVIGPMMAASGDTMERGDVAEGIGELATNAYLTLSPFAPKGAKGKPAILQGPSNAKDAAAVAFAKGRGVPLDAGTATGSQFLKNVQKKVGSSYGGANITEVMQGQQADALARVGGELASDTGAKVTNPVAAGEGVRGVLTKQIQDLHAKATNAYERLRAAEQKAEPDMVAARGVPKANPANPGGLADAFQNMQLAVDLRSSRAALKPVYENLLKKRELTGQLMGAEGRAAVALNALMTGPDFAPLSTVDAALGDIKALARGADMPELRNAGQSIAARAVQQLDAQVRARASRAGADVLKALDEGRAATKQKFVVADTLDMLSGEPGQVFRQLTQNKDVGVARLRAVQRLAPQEMPKLARAFLEDMLQQATSEGGFTHADRLFSNWQKLGSETKQALFPKKGQIADLDNYFLLAKRIKENPNPSGTAQVLNATNLVTAIPSWAVAKMLLTPDGVKALTTARVASKSASPAARTVALTNLTKAAQSAGVPLEAIPAFGQSTPPATRSGTAQ